MSSPPYLNSDSAIGVFMWYFFFQTLPFAKHEHYTPPTSAALSLHVWFIFEAISLCLFMVFNYYEL